MNRADLLQELRHVLDDVAGPPFAWPDQRLIRMMADGEDRFCEQTGYFTDFTTYTITTTAGETRYALPSDRIVEVKEVWDGAHRLRQFVETDRPMYRGTDINLKRPIAWQMDQETGVLTLLEPSLPDIVLALRVQRRAAVRLDAQVDGRYVVDTPAIPQQCHLAVVEYAAARALSDHDRERQDPVKAADHMSNFNDYVMQGRRLFDRINGASPRIVPSRQYVV